MSDPAVIDVMRKRADFLACARARRQGTKGMMVQARRRRPEETTAGAAIGAEVIRVGFTCSKKVGNAVARNRAKRRLREIARAVLPSDGRDGYDYVLIGRAEKTATHDILAMQADLQRALRKLHT